MPKDARPEPPVDADEATTLSGLLDYHRATLLMKASGVSDEDLRRSMVPSGVTLLGLVKHLAFVERWWFRACFAGEDVDFPWTDEDPDADWRVEPDETTEQIFALYREETERARGIAQRSSLDALATRRERENYTLRWIMGHMVQETARHNGHADIIRELTDGTTGE
jgi:uncharacterized damage-inducible protein DinB